MGAKSSKHVPSHQLCSQPWDQEGQEWEAGARQSTVGLGMETIPIKKVKTRKGATPEA